eukprot:CAMPEP_0171109266 /NCGR_PEP_ID=MMETSP0766_2-20121228/70648_1 /TAXON_ID=439317 /ORGANISM="Gambierdiscus australes, Strain CAWD 149" /LENGTH=288 /DNA_ID=CAMNT_0011570985 /DNA_START=78 /DNA_END=944 /DNA_ORIENTATION=+
MMIDAYDVLGLSLDCSEEDIRKAYKRASLQCHPDKVQASGVNRESQNEKFHEIKLAYDILQDADRRKIYDTFGVDLGEERPEMEVWSIGLSTLVSPMGGFALKTAVSRAALWVISFKWVGILLVIAGVVVACLYAVDFTFRDMSIRSKDSVPFLLTVGAVDAVLILYWLWPLLADAVNVAYLVSEVVGAALLIESWKGGAVAVVASLILARLFRGWWLWILGIEVVIAIVLLVALTVAGGIMRLWIESVQTQHADKLKEWRESMRRQRKVTETEIADLRREIVELRRK